MLKKAGLLTVGVTAGLLAVAPIASAGEYEGDHDKGSDKDSSHDKDHGKKHHKHHGKHHDADQEGVGNIKCAGEGGSADTLNKGGDGLLGSVAQAGSVASGNGGQILSCNSILNNVLDHNEVNVLSGR